MMDSRYVRNMLSFFLSKYILETVYLVGFYYKIMGFSLQGFFI